MNATQTRLNAMTVKALREIAREIGIKGLSSARKDALVHALSVWIEGCHTDALAMDSLYVPTRKMAEALETLVEAVVPEEIVPDSIIIPANPIIGPMINEYGFTAHGNTYSVDYHQVSESMRTPKPVETVDGDADHYARVAVAFRMNLPHLAAMAPADLKAALPEWIDIAHMWASDENATIDEAYGARCEDNGITIPAYLACRKAHVRKGEIKSGGFWECCNANPTHVVTFDDGVRQAVCKGCASAYTGEVAEIPADLVTTYRCECGDSYFATQDDWDNALAEIDAMPVTEETVSEEIVPDSIAAHSCATWERDVRISDCDSGCKIYGCEKCGRERLIHNRMYGCTTGLRK